MEISEPEEREMDRLNLDVMGFNEVEWKDSMIYSQKNTG